MPIAFKLHNISIEIALVPNQIDRSIELEDARAQGASMQLVCLDIHCLP